MEKDCLKQSSLFYGKSQVKGIDPALAWRSCGITLINITLVAGMSKLLVTKGTYIYLHSALVFLATKSCLLP